MVIIIIVIITTILANNNNSKNNNNNNNNNNKKLKVSDIQYGFVEGRGKFDGNIRLLVNLYWDQMAAMIIRNKLSD